MPAHYTPKEFAIREAKRKAREQQPWQMNLFSNQTLEHPAKEWITEKDGHRYKWRSYGTHAECHPIG